MTQTKGMKSFFFFFFTRSFLIKAHTHTNPIKALSIGLHAVYAGEFTVQQLEEPFEIIIKDVAASAACSYDIRSDWYKECNHGDQRCSARINASPVIRHATIHSVHDSIHFLLFRFLINQQRDRQ